MKKNLPTKFLCKNIFALLLLFYCFNNLQAQNTQSRLWAIPPKQIGFPAQSVSNLPSAGIFPYNGLPATYACNAMHDANGNLLFFVIDGRVWDKNGRWIGDINVTPIGDRVNGTSEWVIVPVPGNCKQYYLIGGRYTSISPSVGGLPIPYYIVVDLSLAGIDPVAIGGFTTPTAILLTTTSPSNFLTGSTNIAVTPLISSGDRFLFVGDNTNIYRFRVTGNGIVYDNYFTPDLPMVLNAPGSIARTEMEVVKLSNGNYRLALGYEIIPVCPSGGFPHHAIFVGDLDASGTLISQDFFPLPCFSIPKYFIKGLEFSPNGRYLYATHTESPYIQFIDLQAPTPTLTALNPVLPNPNSILNPQDFEYSQIELGNNGLLYFAKSNGLAALSNPNTPTTSGVWNNLAIPMTVTPSSVLAGGPVFDIRLLNDQIDGEVYQDYGIASPPHFCCLDNTLFTKDNFTASASATWQPGSNPFTSIIGNSATVTVRDKLVIPPGVNITIQNMTFQFAPGTSSSAGAKVEVQRGSTLTLNNSTFTSYSSCGNGMWQGIEVWGNKNSPQSDLSATGQGRLIITNNSVIENAMEAITTIKTDAAGNLDWDFTGGIIRAVNSVFHNCRRAAQFLTYTLQNTSYFRNCVFETTGPLADPAVKPYAFVSLYDVKGVNFLGCVFKNTSPNLFNAADRGAGIISIDAKYSVQPLTAPQPCKFENLYYGIDASNSSNLNTIYVNKTEFTGNSHGILLTNNKNAVITSNTFDVGFPNDIDPYGLYLNYCNGYQVEDNEFFSSQSNFSYGTIVSNAEVNNRIYKNHYHDNSIGFQYQGILAPIPTDLQVKCNDFSQSQSSNINIAVTSGFIGNQGSCSSNTSTPAGNLFGPCFTPPPPFPPNFTHIWANTSGVGAFTYFSHPDPSPLQTVPTCYTPVIVTAAPPCATAYTNNSCPSTLIPPCNPSCLRTVISDLNSQIAPLRAKLTAGDAPALYQIISSNASAGQIKNALLAPGPYLSDGVLISAITRTSPLPPGHIKEIILPNSPVTQPVMSALNGISLPNGIRNQINAAQTGTSPRAQVEEQLVLLQSQYDFAFSDLLRQYLRDTSLANSMDSVIAFLQTQNNLPAKKSLLQAYLANSSCSSARTLYNQINSATDASFNSFTDLSISLCEQGKTIFELTTSQKQLLETLAVQTSNKEVAAGAQSILRFVYGEPFPEVIEDLIVPESFTIHGFVNQNPSCGGAPAVGDTIIIVDASGNQVSDVTPVVTDANGKFVFNYFDILPLFEDSNALYSFRTLGTFPLESVDNKTISQWISESPVTLTESSAPQEWTQKANFGGTPRSGVTSFVIGNKGYMGTGYDDNSLFQDFWEYAPQTDTWTQKATFPGIARFVAVGFYFAVGDKGYFGTGWNGSGATDQSDFWEYNATSNSWTQKASFGGGERNGAVGFAIGNKGYICTGWNITDYPIYFHQDVWEYDPPTDTWTQKANFPGPGRQGGVGFSIGSKGYIGLGGGGEESNLTTFFNDFWEYEPQTDTWTQKANLPADGRQWAAGFSIGTKGYMGTGGEYPSGPHYSDFWEWDQASDTWTQKADFAGTARNIASGFSIGTKGYLGTGHDGSPKNDFWEFDPSSNTCASSLRSGNNTQPPTAATIISSAISVYPNPNYGEMTIKYFIPKNEKAEFLVYDLMGRKKACYQLTGENNQLNISEKDLSEGIYFYNITSNGTKIKQDKIVIIK